MFNNIISNKLFRQLLLIAAVAVLWSFDLKGQSFLKKMGNGLNTSVNCSCADSMGNIYAVTSKSYDTADVNKWDISTNTWSVITRLPNCYISGRTTCSFLYGKFYMTLDNLSTSRMELMEYSGSWKKKAVFNYFDYSVGMNSIVFKNKLYLVGGFDSINNAYMPNVVTFDGSLFSSAGFPSGYYSGGLFQTAFEIVGDSLYLTSREKIIRHLVPNTWTTVYNNKAQYWLDGIAYHNGMMYGSSGNELIILKNYLKTDSIGLSKTYSMTLKSHKNRLFISEKYGGSANVYVISDKKDIKFVFKNTLNDSSNYSLISNGNNLYYKGSNGVLINGVDYKNIVEIIVDSIKPVGFDTIRGFVFWDKNNNYKKDGNDVWPNYGYMLNTTYNNNVWLVGNSGKFEELVLENANVDYAIGNAGFDSCVTFNFTGYLRSKNTNAGVTIDSLYFPLSRPSTSNKNLFLRSYTSNRARLLDTIPLTISVKNKDCSYNNTVNGTVTVTLDANTTFIHSSPSYTSKNGNVYTFSNLTFNYYTDNLIKLYVVYSNTNYSIGNTVRHYAKLGNITGEDTMDNSDSIVQKIVYSYDPNVKHSVPEGKITKDLKNVRYYIDFQNLGNDDAVRVTVVDTLNLKIPVYEFKMVAASHPYKVSIIPGTNIVTWVFDNIHLKPKVQNDAASKGFIIFDAKLMANMNIGDSIRNKASIFFDYNEPVITNFAVISRIEPVISIKNIENAGTEFLKVYPNPAQDYLHIENSYFGNQVINVFDMKGAIIAKFDLKGMESKMIETGHWPKGMYILTNNLGEHLKLMIE